MAEYPKRSLDRLDGLDAPLHDTDPDASPRDASEGFGERIGELLSDRGALPGTIRILESFDEQLREKGWLSVRQRALVEQMEQRRDRSRRGRF
jgi:hypothetical protein